MVKKAGKALVLGLSLLLGAVIGAWLSFAALYWLLVPEHRASDAPFVLALAALFAGIVLVVRRMFGRAGLVILAIAVVLAATVGALMFG